MVRRAVGEADGPGWQQRLLSRRAILRYSVLSAMALGVTAACQQAATPAPTSAPAKPTGAAAPAAPAAGQPTTAPAVSKAAINGKLAVVQSRDFHPDHNTFIENKIKEFATQQNYPLDHSYIEAYAGAGNVVEKLTATVLAGEPPDVLIHNLMSAQLRFLDIIEDVDALEQDIERQHGKVFASYERAHRLENKWWAIPHFGRANGIWIRLSAFQDAGIDPFTELSTFDKLRDASLKVSRPESEFWGWGRTANRSGDGDGIVRDAIFQFGGQIADETGELVVLNKDPYRQGAIAGLTFVKEIYTDPQWARMLPPGVGGWTDPTNNEAYLAGKVAMTANAGTVFAKAIVDKNPVADDTYLLVTPGGVGPGARQVLGNAESMNFFIMKGAKNREAAEQLIRSLMTPAVYKEMFKISTGYVYPARAWGWDEPEIKESTYAKHVTDNWRKQLEHPSGFIGTAWPGPSTPQAGALDTQNFLTDMFGEVLTGKSVEDALKSGQDRAVRTFREFGAKGE